MPQKFVYLGIINNRPCAKLYNENIAAMGDNEALCSVPPDNELVYLREQFTDKYKPGEIYEADYIITVHLNDADDILKSQLEKCDKVEIFGILFEKKIYENTCKTEMQ